MRIISFCKSKSSFCETLCAFLRFQKACITRIFIPNLTYAIHQPKDRYEPFCQKLHDEQESALERIAIEEDDRILVLAERSIQVVKNVMEQLRAEISRYTFPSQEEEIYFFKEIKPRFYSKLIYYLKVYRIETRRPTGSNETQQKYLQKELRRLTHYFEENLQFYQYYRSGATYLDEKYFLRGKQDIYLTLDTYHFDADPNFSTSHDFRVAKIHAHELLRIYLIGALDDLERKDDATKAFVHTKQPVAWTASKTSLIELLYALQSFGAFNNGAADIKQLAGYFEQIFAVDLGNYYRIFQQIRIRKGNRATFLETLIEKLEQRMDESDENPKQYF